MRIALLAPLPGEQTGIADYAENFCLALEQTGVTVIRPLTAIQCSGEAERAELYRLLERFDWHSVDLVHAELGGGRYREFLALNWLQQHSALPLTATVHDPERLIWKSALPWPLSLLESTPGPAAQLGALLWNPVTLCHERASAQQISRLITLTHTGADRLRRRMRISASQSFVIPHGNQLLAQKPLPDLKRIRLLYFGFIYRGKGVEDLLQGLSIALQRSPQMRDRVCLTLAGGTMPEVTFGHARSYLDELASLLKQLNLESLVEWQLDLPATRIAELVQAHHLLVLPYRESTKLRLLGQMRGTSGVLSWANACGRGVITSDARSFPEEVSSGNGVTYAEGNPEDLALKLQAVFSQPELLKSWATAAGQIGKKRQWGAVATEFKQLFKRTIKENHHVR